MTLTECEEVLYVRGDMCRQGLPGTGKQGTAPVKKSTGWLTNSPCIADKVGVQCLNTQLHPEEQHRHVHLLGGRDKHAEKYTRELCRAILEGLKDQMREDGIIGELAEGTTCEEKDWSGDWEEEEAWDDVTGKKLQPKEVKKARSTELQYCEDMKLADLVPEQEAWAVSGKAPDNHQVDRP